MADSNSDILQTGEIGDDEDTHVSEDLGEYDTQDGTATEDSAILNDTNYLEDDADLEAIKLRMKEMEEEARKLREFNSESDDSFNISSANASHLGSPHLLSADEKKEIDGRSIYVGNVDYGATAEELEQHFHGCGSINRVTINCDKFSGHPKGFAYIEFAEPDSIDAAKALDESLFRGRQIKVVAKRTNVPGHSTTNRPPRGRGRGARARGFRGSYRGRSFRGAYRSRGRYNSYYSPY